jgi:antitoxin component of MazEF toxin-antitoxin module
LEREEVTVLYPASKNGRSLKTTFPMSIVKLLRLKEGDKIRWGIKATDNKIIVIVEPLYTKIWKGRHE